MTVALALGLGAGVALAFFWAVINWALDLVMLVALMGSPLAAWVVGVGLR